MTSQNRIFDDFAKLMTNAMGVAQGARTEAETAMKGWVDRWLADRDFVTREEFEAVREMAVKARTENAELRARLDRLDPASAATASAATIAAINAAADVAVGASDAEPITTEPTTTRPTPTGAGSANGTTGE